MTVPSAAPVGKHIQIEPNGDVFVDGVKITPSQAAATATEVDKLWREVANKQNWSIKNVEKGVLWLAGISIATNGFGQIPGIPPSVRLGITGAAAFALAAIHISTPKAP